MVNFSRKVLGENGPGHFSPISAYNAAEDRILLMDVATYKYPPAWVKLKKLWQAMNTWDDASESMRGFILIEP